MSRSKVSTPKQRKDNLLGCPEVNMSEGYILLNTAEVEGAKQQLSPKKKNMSSQIQRLGSEKNVFKEQANRLVSGIKPSPTMIPEKRSQATHALAEKIIDRSIAGKGLGGSLGHLKHLLHGLKGRTSKNGNCPNVQTGTCRKVQLQKSADGIEQLNKQSHRGYQMGSIFNIKKQKPALENNKSSVLIQNNSGPLLISKQKLFPEEHGMKSKESSLARPDNMRVHKPVSPASLKLNFDKGIKKSSSFEKRFNLALRKNSINGKTINKNLRNSVEAGKPELRLDIRCSIGERNKRELNLKGIIADNLDSSMEREEELDEEPLGNLPEDYKVMVSTANETTQLKHTEGSLSSAGKSPYEQLRKPRPEVPQNSFRDLLGISKKSMTPNESKNIILPSKKDKFASSSYYYSHLFKSLGSGKRLETSQNLYLEHFELTAKCFNYFRAASFDFSKPLSQRAVYLPPNSQKKKTLVLDLDETLVHCNDSVDDSFDHLLNIKTSEEAWLDAAILIRPGLKEFIKKVTPFYEIVIFTASESYYANEVLNLIDPTHEFITYRLYKEHCYETPSGHHIKDLRIIKNRDLANIVLVDNAAYSYAAQPQNGVPIYPFFSNRADLELSSLANYLIELSKCNDIRAKIEKDFHLDLFKKYSFDTTVLKQKLLDRLAL